MQIIVDKECSKYQIVKFENEFYELCQLGFGLNCAPEIMKAVVSKVLSLDDTIRAATDHYYDDIIVDLNVTSVERVRAHLLKYGLVCKPSEQLSTARVLGLQLSEEKDGLYWRRPDENWEVDILDTLTRRQMFSLCGKITGHYPVAGWLRVALSFIKRSCEGTGWDELAGPVAVMRMKEVLSRMRNEDPVKGKWSVPSHGVMNIWCDASKIAYGITLEKGGKVIEDGSWLRKLDDGAHINLAELNAVIKGVNVAMKWGAKDIVIKTDSAAVHAWMSSILKRDKRIRVSGLSEMLVKRRLSLLVELLEEYQVNWDVTLVPSSENKADVLTRVPKKWLIESKTPKAAAIQNEQGGFESAKQIHNLHHCGVETTLYFAKEAQLNVTRKDVEAVVRNCSQCNSIDPSPLQIEHGELAVEKDWQRVAIDVTHLGNQKYLTIVDCGPSRFAVWRAIRSESEGEVIPLLRQVFSEFGPPKELLCDNSKTFTSKAMRECCKTWHVSLTFRCAYRPSGNGIVERNHRTVKRMCARLQKSVDYCVFWYNVTPHGEQRIVPSSRLHRHEWRNPFLQLNDLQCESNACHDSVVTEGDRVWVKPPGARCTSQWDRGVVTKINSRHNVEVNGVPRHVCDIRPRNECQSVGRFSALPFFALLDGVGTGTDVELENINEPQLEHEQHVAETENTSGDAGCGERRGSRERRAPSYLNDYVLDDL